MRAWTHLERQRGGLGFVGGPGETQIESDKRAIDSQLRALHVNFEKWSKLENCTGKEDLKQLRQLFRLLDILMLENQHFSTN